MTDQIRVLEERDMAIVDKPNPVPAELFASADPVEDLERWADDGGAVPDQPKPNRGRRLLKAIGKAHHGGYFTGSEQR